MSEPDPDLKKLDDALRTLSEHFDSVHIFATRHEPTTEGGTLSVERGTGHWNARIGQIKEWVIMQDEFVKVHARKKAYKEDAE